ncbi:FAD-binding oxidoreductase [Rhodopseudomonas palustris]|uniref:NAD(P)/FAD-dependent oxidoreductase n=1 Tax=Rhodopseudomonas palustris TaxID=1076 RepID=UPI002ACD5A97|nr:FAD-binding oxidoreductase [Rhodopseudomonas palustris]WQH01879.1 FAD-binding oxidoreductase [Rhodopseudomonas palustris]
MTPPATSATNGPDPLVPDTAADPHARLTFDLDVDLCVIGAGLAGLSVALEAAQQGLSVAVLEARRVGWGASGATLGSVMPGYGVPVGDLIERIGLAHTRDLWALSREGMAIVAERASEEAMPGIALTAGALEVSNVDLGDRLIERLQTLGVDFGTEVEGWQIDRVRDTLRTDRYFHAIHFPDAFQLDGRRYIRGLEAMARRAGVRIFEDTPALGIDFSGIRKRIATPHARLRASDIVLAGNVDLGAPSPRLTATLLPMWRAAALTAPLGERLAEAIAFPGSITDTDGVDHYRIVGGDRLLWTGPETTFPVAPKRLEGLIRRRIAALYPQLGAVAIAQSWSGAIGQTVHGMPQIGELRRGLWVASGFGRQGLATTAIAGRLIAQGIVHGDQRWRLFDPFELVWAGGRIGRVVGQGVSIVERRAAMTAGLLARYRERAAARSRLREERLEAANSRVRVNRGQRPAAAAPQDRGEPGAQDARRNEPGMIE